MAGRPTPKRGRQRNRRFVVVKILLLAGLIGGTLMAAVYFMFLGPGPQLPMTVDHEAPAYRDLPDLPPPHTPPPPELTPSQTKHAPRRGRIALIIDDMGYHKEIGRQLIALDCQLTFSFLPYAPHSPTLIRQAKKRGRDILLHLPLEATDPKWDLGPGALVTSMAPAVIQATFKDDLARVPSAIGVNNHMGSRFTTNRAAMTVLLTAIDQAGLFFLDSLTSAASVGYRMAREKQMTALRRDVFLDNDQHLPAINRQLALLEKIAQQRGTAIGIAHPKAVTLAALQDFARRPGGRAVVPLRQLVGRRR